MGDSGDKIVKDALLVSNFQWLYEKKIVLYGAGERGNELPQRLHLHLPRKGICFPVHPSGQTAPKTVLIIISDPAHPDLLLLLKALSACAV